MALSLTFSFGAPCATGEHFPVTATLTGAVNKSKTVAASRDILTNPPSADDVDAAVIVLLRLLILQLSNKANANVKTVVEAKTINLTVVG